VSSIGTDHCARGADELLNEAADEIKKLREQRTEARLLLDEVQAKHASDPLPERIYDFLRRTKERT
jgi:hypothetical protein